MKVACVLYENFTALDLIGPYEVIGGWPDAEMHYLAMSDAPVASDHGLTVTPTDTPATLPAPDVVLIPGSSRPLEPLADQALLEWVRGAAESATWMTSVCTGTSIYAAAGLLAGRRATTHWVFREPLAAMGVGVEVSTDRVVFDGKFVSGAGVSAGIDMALALTARVHGDEIARQIQLAIEYDPQPPFDSGAPEKASPEILAATRAALLEAAGVPAA
jgi:transcriptional regulator GlxA family with amidase domain